MDKLDALLAKAVACLFEAQELSENLEWRARDDPESHALTEELLTAVGQATKNVATLAYYHTSNGHLGTEQFQHLIEEERKKLKG